MRPSSAPCSNGPKKLKAVAIHGIGANPIDLEAATDHGVMICRTPDANIQSVAEHAIGLMLAVGHRLPDMHQAVRERNFSARYEPDFQEFHRKTLLIVGWGRDRGADRETGAGVLVDGHHRLFAEGLGGGCRGRLWSKDR